MPFSLERTAVLQLASFGVGVDEFAVNSAVVSSAAAMANPLHPPIIHFTTNKLRITRNQIEGQVNLGSVEFSNKIEQSLANTDPLKVRQNHQPANSKMMRLHTNMSNRDKRHWPIQQLSNVAAYSGTEFAV
jgi:hypothetical protein